MWLTSSAAVEQMVFLYEAGKAPQALEVLNGVTGRSNPGTLQPGTLYHWRVDSSNSNGTTVGPVWSFTTDPTGEPGPSLAIHAAPPLAALVAGPNQDLRWVPAPGLSSQRLTVRSPHGGHDAGLAPGRRGRVLARRATGRHCLSLDDRLDRPPGPVPPKGRPGCSRPMHAPLSDRAARPSPAHLVDDVPLAATLSWTGAADALAYRLHLDTAYPPALCDDHSAGQPRPRGPCAQHDLLLADRHAERAWGPPWLDLEISHEPLNPKALLRRDSPLGPFGTPNK